MVVNEVASEKMIRSVSDKLIRLTGFHLEDITKKQGELTALVSTVINDLILLKDSRLISIPVFEKIILKLRQVNLIMAGHISGSVLVIRTILNDVLKLFQSHILQLKLNVDLSFKFKDLLKNLSQEGKRLFRNLMDPDYAVRRTAVSQIKYFSFKKLIPVVFELLDDPEHSVTTEAIHCLQELKYVLPPTQVVDILSRMGRLGLEYYRYLMSFMDETYIPELENLLTHHNAIVRRNAVGFLDDLGSIKSLNKVKKLRSDPDKTVRIAVKGFIFRKGEGIESHVLYAGQEDKFFSGGTKGSLGSIPRQELWKTGSRLIRFGGSFVGKLVLRIVSQESYKAWEKAFLSNEHWAKLGFDYIPIEPIFLRDKNKNLRLITQKDVAEGWIPRLSSLKAPREKSEREEKLSRSKLEKDAYAVITGVLGPNLNQYSWSGKENKKELTKIALRIINGLGEINIWHGHPHPLNFCIGIDDENRVKLFDGKPRLYLIDFDEARFTKKPTEEGLMQWW